MEPTYYYYRVDAKNIDRTFTIEFSIKPEDNPEEVLQKTINVAKTAFLLMSTEREKVKDKISEYVSQTRADIKNIPSLRQRKYLELLSHLIEYEEAENIRFKKQADIHEIKKLSTFMSGHPKPTLQHTDKSDSWKYSTHFGANNSSDTILVQIFEQKANKSLLNFEIDYLSMSPSFSVCSRTFTMISFEKHLIP